MSLLSRKNQEYLKNFKLNEEGKYIYEGTLFLWKKPQERKKMIRRFWIMAAVMIALPVASGCIPAPGVSFIGYILIPYALSVTAPVLCAFSLSRLSSEEDKVRDYIYNSSVRRLPRRSLLSAAACLASAAAEIIYIAGSGFGNNLLSALLFIIMEGAAAVVSLRFRTEFTSLQWEEVPGK